jgi:hypothetical protein
MELNDKIISSACESKLVDFVMFVSCVIIYFFTGHMELHDKIISSACESKLVDFVMFV